MGARKIQDESEVIRWFEQGVTYEEMVERYREKYNIETTPSMWGNFRRRRGLDRRITRDDELIPWGVKVEHRHDYPILMLRKEARRRAGLPLSEEDEHAVDAWIAGMKEANTVLHYDPDTEDGWFYVRPRPGVDTDLIRVPDKATGKRAAD
jgi:hypothetical protein